MNCSILVKKVLHFYKGSNCDNFDTMVKDISQLTQLQDNLIMTDETYQAPITTFLSEFMQ